MIDILLFLIEFAFMMLLYNARVFILTKKIDEIKNDCATYEEEFRSYYAQEYEFKQIHQYQKKTVYVINMTVISVLYSLKFANFKKRAHIKKSTNEIAEYFNKLCVSFVVDIFEAGGFQKFIYFTFAQMIKNVLMISVFEIDVEKLFSMTRDVIHYRRNCLYDFFIEKIMILKHAYQVVDEFIKTKNLFFGRSMNKGRKIGKSRIDVNGMNCKGYF